MENINFKVIGLQEATTVDFDLYDAYYNKFIEIYGLGLADVMASNMKDDVRKYDILAGDSKNFQMSNKAIKDIDNGECLLFGIFSNNILLGVSRVYIKEEDLLVPDIIFKSIYSLEEQYYLYSEFVKYLESTYEKKVYIEIPNKEIDLKNILTSDEFKVELDEGNGQYNLTRTFLITKK